MSRRPLPVLAALGVAAAVSTGSASETPEATRSRATETEASTTRRVLFMCPRDTLLTVEFVTSEPDKPAVVQPPTGPALTLSAQESGSGYRYADDHHELRGKGREVTWTDESGQPVVCTEQATSPGGTEPN